ncbi:hypothetical protein A3L09_06150 [Thermococcus profundus]|uniref:Uncharacterized protein n=1 Tax=Thermococcus profundus TaxID=49899 RepID=A0A2Z2MLP7_THEPR|nr:hypothetical protein [Thermococcus profundus]ASJ02868.1 hypothetical protein A3L09_06150 [Thermococcus profundus]
MDTATLLLILGGFIGTILVVVVLISKMMSTYTSEIYELLRSSRPELQEVPVQEKASPPKVESAPTKIQGTVPKPTASEEELVRKLREILNERMGKIIDEAKDKKNRLLTLLDFARGYALGYVSEDDYNAFLIKVLNELDEFKRLWLMKFPSRKDKEKLELMMSYVAKAKLPVAVKTKDKGIITLTHEEALIKITEYLNSAMTILDELIEKAGESPAITPLEIKLSNEVKKLQEKVKRLEERLEEMNMNI